MYYNGFVILHISNYGCTSNENGEIRIGSRENYLFDFSINNCFQSFLNFVCCIFTRKNCEVSEAGNKHIFFWPNLSFMLCVSTRYGN